MIIVTGVAEHDAGIYRQRPGNCYTFYKALDSSIQ